jgi:hypothetical protein
MNNPDHIFESLETIFWVKILTLLCGIRNGKIRIRDGKNSDPGSKIGDRKIWSRNPQHCFSHSHTCGSAESGAGSEGRLLGAKGPPGGGLSEHAAGAAPCRSRRPEGWRCTGRAEGGSGRPKGALAEHFFLSCIHQLRWRVVADFLKVYKCKNTVNCELLGLFQEFLLFLLLERRHLTLLYCRKDQPSL